MIETVALTLDHELFLGERSGTLEACLLTPTDHLLPLLNQHEVKITVFFDVLYYWRLKKEGLTSDVEKLEKNLKSFIDAGHELQLHLHPHWLDASYEKGQWTFASFDRYGLQALSAKEDPNDMETVMGCVLQSKKILEDLIAKLGGTPAVTVFRAGGWCVEPFSQLKNAFEKANLKTDSSVAPGFVLESHVHKINHQRFPDAGQWRFDSDPATPIVQGKFQEIPISAFQNPFTEKLKRRLKLMVAGDEKRQPYGDGVGIPAVPTGYTLMAFDSLTDSELRTGLDFLEDRGHSVVTLIGHTKSLSPFFLDQFSSFLGHLKRQNIRFSRLSDIR